jgi:sugar/nucleoside kinase (ribokinase family)
MDAAYDAVVAGHLCLDVIPDLSSRTPNQVASLFQPGNLSKVGPITFSTGGAVSNTGVALHRLGMRTRLMGMVGDDPFGQEIQWLVEARGEGLTSGMIVNGTTASSYTIIVDPPGVDRIFLHHPGANDVFGAGDVDFEVVAGARLFHFGYPPLMKHFYEDRGAALVHLFQGVKQLGVTASLDMAVPDASSPAGRVDWVAVLQATLPFVDVFMPSIEETLFMLRRETYEALLAQAYDGDLLSRVTPALLSDLSEQVLGMGVKIVGFKLGHRGFYVRTADGRAMASLGTARPADPEAWACKELWAPVFAVDVVGTTGAGDATIAGFLSALLRGMSLDDAVTAAVAVGACNVEAADALGGIRSWDDTWQRVRDGWPRRELRLDEPGWREDATSGHWVRETDGAKCS